MTKNDSMTGRQNIDLTADNNSLMDENYPTAIEPVRLSLLGSAVSRLDAENDSGPIEVNNDEKLSPVLATTLQPEPKISPVEVKAKVAEILEADAISTSRQLIFEVGPFSDLENRLEVNLREWTAPDIAVNIMTKVRQIIHDEVISRPDLKEKEKNGLGLNAREEALAHIKDELLSAVMPILNSLAPYVKGTDRIKHGIEDCLDADINRIALLKRSMQVPSIGAQIIDGMRDATTKFMGAGGGELVGDLRRFRNEQLTKNLSSLTEVSLELKANAGDKVWEQSHGVMAAKHLAVLSKDLAGMVKGIEDQIDVGSVDRILKGVSENMDHAEKHVTDDEIKSHIKEAQELLSKMMESLMAFLNKVFGNGAKNGASAPSP